MIVKGFLERIQSLYSKGAKSDDSRLSNRLIYQVLLSIRNFVVTNQIKKKQTVSDWNYTVLNSLEMIPVNSISSKCFSHLGCTIYRSKLELPRILTSLDKNIITWVMKVDNSEIIHETSRQENLYQKGNKYTSKKLKYIIEDGYLFIDSPIVPGRLAMRFLAEDPIAAERFNVDCSPEQNCKSILEYDFPIDADLGNTVVEMSFKELIQIFSQMPEDKTNNSSDSLKQRSK